VKLQLLSDLHLETEAFDPQPAPDAELLVLAGDIDASWAGFERFAHWPVPVLYVAGNHEFDGRELDATWLALRARAERLGWTLLERSSTVRIDRQGQRIRFVGTIRWCDFDLFGPQRQAAAMRAAAYFMRLMRSTRRGQPFDVAGVRDEALACRAWLAQELRQPADGRWDKTVVITHFAPSLRSADARYGAQPGTASFCNADDDLLEHADLWLHGHLHCRHDYRVARGQSAPTRVVCQARGLDSKGEAVGYDPGKLIEV
jgi:Calcineurin-like phosphoesterase